MNLRLMVMVICLAASAGVVSGQPKMLIEDREGKLEDLRGMRRFYVIAQNAADRGAIAGQINGRQGLRLMRHGTTAQFHVTYMCTRWAGARPEEPSTAELRIAIPRPEAVIIHAWAKKESTPTCKNAAAKTSLVKEFLKDFSGMNGKK